MDVSLRGHAGLGFGSETHSMTENHNAFSNCYPTADMMPSILLQAELFIGLLFSLVVLAIHIGMIIWTYSDAKDNSEQPAFLWAIVVFLAPLLGLVLYLLLGRN